MSSSSFPEFPTICTIQTAPTRSRQARSWTCRNICPYLSICVSLFRRWAINPELSTNLHNGLPEILIGSLLLAYANALRAAMW